MREAALREGALRKDGGDRGVAWAAAAGSLALVLLSGVLAGHLPADWLLRPLTGGAALHSAVVDRFFVSDALWYERVAADWYAWNPAAPGVQQDVAFFPLWPAVLWLIGQAGLGATAVRWGTVCAAAVFAVAGIVAFHGLAQRLLPRRGARIATLLFALAPGGNFLWDSYPAGLMNLLSVLVVLAVIDGRIWRAAVLSGVMTAAGPLALGCAMTVCFCAAAGAWARLRGRPAGAAAAAREAARLVGVGAVSVAGLLVFLVVQQVKFGDAFAFLTAQRAWVVPLAFLPRVWAFVSQLLVVPDLFAAVHALKHLDHAPSLAWLQHSLQKSLNLVLEAVAILAIAASAKLRCRPVLLQGVCTLVLFVWFHAASRPGGSTPRLLYPALAIFLGVGWVLRDRAGAGTLVVVLSGLLLAGAAVLSAAGYSVV